MPLSLEQYADHLDTRDLPWPSAPPVERPKAKPCLAAMPHIRAVLWTAYGTLLEIPPTGELLFEHPNDFVTKVTFEKTIAEFKMWGAMSRKPGQPSVYMAKMFGDFYMEQKQAPSGHEKFPEIISERIWEGILKRLMQKEYHFDTAFFGAINEYSRKIAYFFHASMQATACYPTADRALLHVAGAGIAQGLLADGQCFTPLQLQRGLAKMESPVRLDDVMPPAMRFLSCDHHGRKPSERLFRHALDALKARGIEPGDVLHVGSNIMRDIAPAKKKGMKTALFAGDKSSLSATPEQLKDPATRPDLLITELDQISQVVG